jgi:hypothetical protein
LLVQHACISVHLTVDTDEEKTKILSLEVDLKPIELVYRERTFSQLSALAGKLGDNKPRKQSNTLTEEENNGQGKMVVCSALCTISSIAVSVPVVLEDDISRLFTRCGYYSDGSSSSHPALGFVFDNVSLEYKQRESNTTAETASSFPTTTLDIHSFVMFVSAPEHTNSPIRRRSRVFDIFAATGRLEVDPFIPITIAYKGETKGSNVARDAFPSVPAFSSFKARQEDEDEDDAIDRILSEKLNGGVNVDSRRALRAQDPQGNMLSEAEKCDAVIMVHVPDIMLDLSKEELQVLLEITKCISSATASSDTADNVERRNSPTTTTPPLAISIACDSFCLSLLNTMELGGRRTRSAHLLRLDKCRVYTVRGGPNGDFLRSLCHEVTLFEGKSLSTLFWKCRFFKLLMVLVFFLSNPYS